MPAADIPDPEAFPETGAYADKLAFLLEYARLAPSLLNSQPWQFSLREHTIGILPDLERWQPVTDPERRELYLSLGCALENLLTAAEYFRLGFHVAFGDSERGDETFARVQFVEGASINQVRDPGLFHAIVRRRTCRRPFLPKLIPHEELLQLRNARLESDLTLRFLANLEQKRRLAELVAAADRRLLANPDYRRELAGGIRRGMWRLPGPLTPLAALAVRHLNPGPRLARRERQLLTSAPVLAVLASRNDTPVDWIRTGQLFERLALTATKLGLAIQPMNHLLQVRSHRHELASMLPDSRLRPHLFLRLGYADGCGRPTPRDPLSRHRV